MSRFITTVGKPLVVLFFDVKLSCIASTAQGWEHVTVYVKNEKRCPTWEEMCHVKAHFWPEHVHAVQYHPQAEEYVQNCEHTLHLWAKETLERPPRSLVGEGMFDE